MLRSLLIGVAMMALPAPLVAAQTAIGSQILEDFEGRALGPTSINFCDIADPTDSCLGTLSGGAVALGTPAFPAFSPTHVYTGSFITLDIANKVDFCWPAVSARVTGTAPILLTVFKYDYDLQAEVFVGDVWTAANAVNTLLFFGDEDHPQFLTRIEFSSDAVFAMDDFRVGLPDVAPGIPEPSSWMLLIAGFGMIGTSLRRRTQLA